MDDVHLILLIGNLLGEDVHRTGMGDVERGGCETVTLRGVLVKQKHFPMGRVLWSAVCFLHSVMPEGIFIVGEGRGCLFSCMSGQVHV